MKIGDKVELLKIPKCWKGWGFENSTIKKIWIGSITHKEYAIIESDQGHIMKQVDLKLLKEI